MSRLSVAIILSVLLIGAHALRSHEEWVYGNRRIYQILTDRFATNDPNSRNDCDRRKYCGGTWRGIERELDYIADLGFNAIWISPHTRQVDVKPGDEYEPYHAYHTKNMYEVNPQFGTKDELHSLVRAAHARDIWVIFDIVVNHFGPTDYNSPAPYSSFVPFNREEHYHDCNGCPASCQIEDWNNPWQMEHCRIAGLPDLNQDNPQVRKTLIDWVVNLADEYNLDGFRVDTVVEVKNSFWADMHTALGDGLTIGELFSGNDAVLLDAVVNGRYPSLFAYPLFFAMQESLLRGGSMWAMVNAVDSLRHNWSQVSRPYAAHHAMAPFTSNHDNPRLMTIANNDENRVRNAISFVMMFDGISTFYYGEEQGFRGGNPDYNNREPLWTSGFNRNTGLFEHTRKLNQVRDIYGNFFTPSYPARFSHVEDRWAAFFRGPVLTLVTGVGANGGDTDVYLGRNDHGFLPGDEVCNVFWSERVAKGWKGDCVTIGSDGAFRTQLFHGESKVFVLARD